MNGPKIIKYDQAAHMPPRASSTSVERQRRWIALCPVSSALPVRRLRWFVRANREFADRFIRCLRRGA